MDDTSITTAALDLADEDILIYTVSDEALEAAAGTEGGPLPNDICLFSHCSTGAWCRPESGW